MSHLSMQACVAVKVALRRHFLQTYHAQDKVIPVMDCFAGSGETWRPLREEFAAIRYWEIDVKEKKGRLKLDSARILEAPGWRADVVDLDAYGSPWRHWENLLRTAKGPKTVFLTIGVRKKAGGGSNYAGQVQTWLGIPESWSLPPSLGASLADMSVEYAIYHALDCGWEIPEIREAFPQDGARYLGVRLVPDEWKQSKKS